MMNADQLVQQALDALKTNHFYDAKQLLKQASSLAPLRTDIKDLLTYAIEKEATERDTANGKPAARHASSSRMGHNTASGRSQKFLVMTGVIIVVLLALFAMALLVVPAILRSVAPSEPYDTPLAFDTPAPELSPDPTPDPLAEKRAELEKTLAKQIDEKKFQDAIETLGQILATNPPDAEAYREKMARMHYSIGLVAEEKRDYDDAIVAYQKAFEAHSSGSGPDEIPYSFRLGNLLYRRASLSRGGSAQQSDLNTARRHLERAAEINPDWLRTYETLALVHVKLNDRTAATRYYTLIIEKAPGTPEAEKAERALRSMGAVQ